MYTKHTMRTTPGKRNVVTMPPLNDVEDVKGGKGHAKGGTGYHVKPMDTGPHGKKKRHG